MDWFFKKGSIILKNTSSKRCCSNHISSRIGKRKEDTLLDAKDLSAIAEIVGKAVQESEARMIGLIQESEERTTGLIQESETRMTKLIQESIQASENRMTKLIQESIQASEDRMTKLIQTSIQASEDRLTRRMKKMLFKSESMLLDEMERYDKKNEKRFEKIERELDGLKDIYRVTKNEQETITLLLHSMKSFEKRLTALEVRTA